MAQSLRLFPFFIRLTIWHHIVSEVEFSTFHGQLLLFVWRGIPWRAFKFELAITVGMF